MLKPASGLCHSRVFSRPACELATAKGLSGSAGREKGEGGLGGVQPYARRAQLQHIWVAGRDQYAHAARSAVELSFYQCYWTFLP